MPVPCTITDKTFTVYDKATLYVPTGTREAYAVTATWNKFTKIEEFTPTGMEEVRWMMEEGRSKMDDGRGKMDDGRCEVYDLCGRQVQGTMKPGVNIVNGRKILK